MPVTPTYPGVYIEEVPSAVRTIVGVSTSVTAFVGYTERGQTDTPVQVFNFGDFERAFGNLHLDSPVAYAVQQFFQNGGIEAWVVRVARDAATAAVDLENAPATDVLRAFARSQGAWGNNVRLEVDYDTANPDDLFNLTVTELRPEGDQLVAGTTETLRNLSLGSSSPTFAPEVARTQATLIKLERRPAAVGTISAGRGTAESRPFTPSAFPYGDVDNARRRLVLTVNGQTREVVLDPARIAADVAAAATAADRVAAVGDEVTRAAGVAGLTINNATTGSGSNTRWLFTDATPGGAGEHSAVSFARAASEDAAALLGLGLTNGGREISASAALRPVASGTLGTDLAAALGSTGTAALDRGGTDDSLIDVRVFLAGATPHVREVEDVRVLAADQDPPTSLEGVAPLLEAGLRAAAEQPANVLVRDELAGARVRLEAGRLRVVPGGRDEASFEFRNATGDTATAGALGLTGGGVSRNIARYALGVGPDGLAQSDATRGSDGTPPQVAQLRGNFARKEGLYALRDVDIFNILSIPTPRGLSEGDYRALVADALTFCEERRAFMIVDLPEGIDQLTEAQAWINDPATPKSKNAAAYFPWVMQPDPLRQYRSYAFPPSGMLAGLYARTDGTRGVWKAPAGTEATLRGPDSVLYKLTDLENGTLNPLGLNAIRALPVYGHVAWGARTLFGANQLASEWKYIPVRRTALFIEETLYRGTQWVVFEPNDEPLWSQIRLNVGAFLHSLFRQGAFQGKAPREAYLVKCDAETTTQDDINRGVVNILVGFAPLKPAEFVIIKLSQLAGQVEA